MKFQNKGAVPVQIASLVISQPLNQIQSKLCWRKSSNAGKSSVERETAARQIHRLTCASMSLTPICIHKHNTIKIYHWLVEGARERDREREKQTQTHILVIIEEMQKRPIQERHVFRGA